MKAVYGYASPLLLAYESGTTKMESIEQCLQERNKILSLLKNNLEAAQCKMKVQANKKMTEMMFEVRDGVYLRLFPYQHKSLPAHPFHKLQLRFYDPFQVVAKVGNVAYKIKLPEQSKLHPMFHISCLKKHLGAHVQTTVPLPVITNTGIL